LPAEKPFVLCPDLSPMELFFLQYCTISPSSSLRRTNFPSRLLLSSQENVIYPSQMDAFQLSIHFFPSYYIHRLFTLFLSLSGRTQLKINVKNAAVNAL
jgi:hypothetical protein